MRTMHLCLNILTYDQPKKLHRNKTLLNLWESIVNQLSHYHLYIYLKLDLARLSFISFYGIS